MNWEKVKLSDVCKIVGGTTPKTNIAEYWNGNITWLSPVDLPEVGSISNVSNSARMISEKAVKESGLTVLPINSIVFSTRASIGKIGITTKPLCTNQGFTNMIPGEKIFYKYLAYVLKNNIKLIEKLGNSTTFNEVSRTAIKDFEILLPPLPTQKRIAEILDAADALRRKDQDLLKKYDELAQAIFIDMFGDPVKNEKGWEVKKLGEILDVDAKVVNPKMLESYNYVGLEHIEKETGKILTIDKGEVLSNKFIFNENHILYGKLRPYLNKVATPDFKGICSTDIFPLKPKKSFLKQFLVSILRSKDFVNHSNTNAVGANLPRANKDIILNYKTIIPNEKIVELFSKNIVSIEFQKLVIEKQIQNSESLFNSLIQKAFNGELVA